ncbi:MAG TPA: AlkA N-terminal domain-containing protein, partial [Acidimicrobiales bacterium]|nr:AlkA N-terminal domain-containing protein [Acidimicrobiales bacterium]
MAAPPFSAVVTTGIYCRPGCPGTPKGENVQEYSYAAAAEAHGFRPCLRCRPDTSPGPPAWLAPSELVCRALRLIGQGALDGAGEEDLARRLGVSERHLRRLFDAHVGATPDAVARSRRVHFARRLLIETDLPVAHVGFASGFGSVRQFNRAMREVFQLPPTELRRRRRRADRLVAPAGLDLRLPYRPPLDWEAMAAFLAARSIPGVEAVDRQSYRRTIALESGAGAIELRPLPDSPHLLLRVHVPQVDGLIHVVDQARRIFDVDADPREVRRHLRRDPVLRPLVDLRPGLRVAGAWDGFELGVRAILGQQVSVKGASTLAARIADRLGTPIPGFEHLGLSRLFPDSERLAGADLGSLGLTSARAATIRRFAEAVASGDLVLDASQGLDGVVEQLRAIPGVGPWTAHYIAMRAAGERDAF